MRKLTAACVIAMTSATSAIAAPLLDPLFQDHAVLQRSVPIPVYGSTKPHGEVRVTLDALARTATANEDGRWQVSFPPMAAGEGHRLEASSADGERAIAQDIAVGDVFLCAGQSNMAFEVNAADNARAEIATSSDHGIRSLTIRNKDSIAPLTGFADPVQWVSASPETTGHFSAACYFFATQMRRTSHVPVGMVVAAWGGSRIRAWVSEQGLHAAGLETRDLYLLDLHRDQTASADRGWDREWEDWWHARHGDGPAPWSPDFDFSRWRTAPSGLGPWALWEGSSPDGFVGQMWLRSQVTLTAAQAAQSAVLDLGMINEEDESWVNGRGVGGTSWQPRAAHGIPAGTLHAGVNTIVTNIFCSWRNCGLIGPADTRAIRLADGTSVPLAGPWRYQQMAADEIAPQLPWGPAHGASVIYNGMVAPIGPYALRAVLWYQGESDVHYAGAYQHMLKALIGDWRRQFGPRLPFLIVQLPDFGPIPVKPAESEIADIREAQRRAALSDPLSDYVVTIDIGNPANIHPTNKQEVGRRLALTAQRLLQGDTARLGPRPETARFSDQAVTVQFSDVATSLVSYSGSPNAFEYCDAAPGSCHYAPARIIGPDRIRVQVGPRRPSRLRYCWGDSPVCNLSDASDLPAGPFEMPIR